MASKRHFLIVEDETVLREELSEQIGALLAAEVTGAVSVQEALEAMRTGPRVDACLIDVDLPDGDGRDLCAALRQQGVNIPILIVSAANRESDIVRGLDAGANDYIVKPFRILELAARIRAQIRAFEASEHAEIVIGDYVFRPGYKELRRPGGLKPVRLTEKEVSLLKFLYRSAGEPVSRHTLLHEVWGYSRASNTHTVETHIYRLRRKVELAADGRPLVLNDGGGYRLNFERSGSARAFRAWTPAETMLAMAAPGGP